MTSRRSLCLFAAAVALVVAAAVSESAPLMVLAVLVVAAGGPAVHALSRRGDPPSSLDELVGRSRGGTGDGGDGDVFGGDFGGGFGGGFG